MTCTRSSVSAPGARDRPRPKQPPQRQSAPNNKPTTQTTNLNNLLEGLLTSRRERRFYERLHSEDFFNWSAPRKQDDGVRHRRFKMAVLTQYNNIYQHVDIKAAVTKETINIYYA